MVDLFRQLHLSGRIAITNQPIIAGSPQQKMIEKILSYPTDHYLIDCSATLPKTAELLIALQFYTPPNHGSSYLEHLVRPQSSPWLAWRGLGTLKKSRHPQPEAEACPGPKLMLCNFSKETSRALDCFTTFYSPGSWIILSCTLELTPLVRPRSPPWLPSRGPDTLKRSRHPQPEEAEASSGQKLTALQLFQGKQPSS